jgi:hypothetical protein
MWLYAWSKLPTVFHLIIGLYLTHLPVCSYESSACHIMLIYVSFLIFSIINSCLKAFSMTRRKHHCRSCGEVFCAKCCSKRVRLGSKKHRVGVLVAMTIAFFDIHHICMVWLLMTFAMLCVYRYAIAACYQSLAVSMNLSSKVTQILSVFIPA